MKILQLELLAYGPFTDETLDLSAGDPGLHIIYGPNEAGKSSTLRAINGLLFGIPTRTNDTFLHDSRSLRIGALLQNSEKKKIHVHRRKGNKDTLLNPKTKKGGAFPADVLDPFLGSVDRETFERVYGISHEELQRGGDEMKSLKGLVGESLFAATVGGSGLAELLRDLDSEATEIYDARKRSAKLKVAVRTHKELQSERRKLQLSNTSWKKLRSEVQKAEERRDEILNRETELAKQHRKLQRIYDGLSLMTRRREVRKKLDELGDAVVLPDNYSGDQRANSMAELNRLRKDIERLKTQLEGEDSLQSKIDAISIPDGLLEFDEPINRLKDERAVVLVGETDSQKHRREQDRIRENADRLLRDLGLGESTSLDEVEPFRITSEQRVQIVDLGNNEKRLRDQQKSLKRQLEELEKQLAAKTERLAELGEDVDLSELRRSVDRITRMGDLESERDELRNSLDTQSAEFEQRLATLQLWSGTTDQVGRISLPLAETVDRFADELSDNEKAITLAQQKIADRKSELLEVDKEIAALQSAGQIPTEQELLELRTERDAQWGRIRDAFVAGKKPKDSTVPAYESVVKGADMLADRLRREAERVTQLAERQAQLARTRQQLEQLEEQLLSHRSEGEKWSVSWKQLWSSTEIDSPLPPREMHGWMRQVDSLQSDSRLIAEKQRQLEKAERELQSVCEELDTLLRAHDISTNDKTVLRRLLEVAENHLETQDSIADDRAELNKDITRLKKEIETTRTDEKQISEEVTEWQTAWTTCMKALGCDESASAAQANERSQRLTELFDLKDEIQSLEKRIDEISTYTQSFESNVRRLGEKFLHERFQSDSQPAFADIALELHALLEAARRGKATRHDLEDKLAAVDLELTDATEREAALSQELETLLNLAGAESIEQLPSLERSAKEYGELKTLLDQLEEQLHHLSGNQTIEEFIASAEEQDADELPIRIESIEREIKSLESDRDEAVVKVNDLERQLREADGNDLAAEKDQQSLGILSGMHDDAAQYMRLRLASTMLKKQIDAHRAENEDPLLERASTLFATMTCGEYAGLRTDYHDDEPVIVGIRKDSEDIVPVDGMSDGTRDQLFLALRLGYVERQLIQHEPLPFIVDDILVHFDNERSASTLKVLGELAQQTQVIFLTHHEHLIDLANGCLPDGDCFVHRIDSRKRIPKSAVSSISAKRPR